MLRPRPGLNPRTSDPMESLITTGPPASTPVYSSTRRKRERRRNVKGSGCLTSTTKESIMESSVTYFLTYWNNDVNFFRYFIHFACVHGGLYFSMACVRFSTDENADARFVWYSSLAGILLSHHQQEPHATKKLLSREFQPRFPVVDSCGADLWTLSLVFLKNCIVNIIVHTSK